jgi:CO dehydrogenase maturation factor
MGAEKEVTLLDLEASIEHLGRATPQGADTLLIVVEPYYRALETAARIAPLARGLGIPNLLAVANKLRDDEDAKVVRDYCRTHGFEIAAEIPFDEAVRDADRRGQTLLDSAPNSGAARSMTALAGRLS